MVCGKKKCSDLVPAIHKKTSFMKSAYGENTLFYAFKYDIKEFFTNMVIVHVMPALQFLFQEMKSLNKAIYGSINKILNLASYQNPTLKFLFTKLRSSRLLTSYLTI